MYDVGAPGHTHEVVVLLPAKERGLMVENVNGVHRRMAVDEIGFCNSLINCVYENKIRDSHSALSILFWVFP